MAPASSVLADFREDMERLAEPVIPGVRADIMRAVETLVTDLETPPPAAPPAG